MKGTSLRQCLTKNPYRNSVIDASIIVGILHICAEMCQVRLYVMVLTDAYNNLYLFLPEISEAILSKIQDFVLSRFQIV